MTFIEPQPAKAVCDHPGCGRTVALPGDQSEAWHEAFQSGWRGYFTAEFAEGGELRHHCPEHPVPTKRGLPIRLGDEESPIETVIEAR